MNAGDLEYRRARNRARTAIVVGALCGIGLGFLIELVWPAFGIAAAVVVGVAGALVARWLVGRVDLEDWEPIGDGHSFVGAYAPDEDAPAR